MRRLLALAACAAILPAAPGSAGPCDEDPACGAGRGIIEGWICWRNELNPVPSGPASGFGNGRLCVPGQGHTVYVYTRWVQNRTWVYTYLDGTELYAPGR